MQRPCARYTALFLLVLVAGCSTGDSEPEAAVCRLGLVDPLPAALAEEADRAEPWLPEVTNQAIAENGAMTISLARDVHEMNAEPGSVAFLAMLDSLIRLNDACAAAGV